MPSIAAGLLGWAVLALGFLGMQMLMKERPEFAGPPTRFARTELLQLSPTVLMRRVQDDVSVVSSANPIESEVSFLMQPRRDYRGLKTVVDLEGTFRGRYTITNPNGQSAFLLFRCPHPRAGEGRGDAIHASALELESSLPGIRQDASDAWVWAGELGPDQQVELTAMYRVAGVRALRYEVAAQQGRPIPHQRVTMDLADVPAVRFESSAGPLPLESSRAVWERKDSLPPDFFAARLVEGRSVYSALLQLAQIGPLVSLLFLGAAFAAAGMKRNLTPLQILTLTAGYGFYFPLVLYLSARFSFPLALGLAALAPGLLLLNYARWLLGVRLGALGGLAFLLLYQIFPTLAAFAAWNRGLVLLCLGGVTLFVLMSLQNRALRSGAVFGAAAGFLAIQSPSLAQEVQVVLPAQLVDRATLGSMHRAEGVLSLGVAHYVASFQARFLEVEVSLPIESLRTNEAVQTLLRQPIHLVTLEAPEMFRFVTSSNALELRALDEGQGTLRLAYRVPFTASGSRVLARIPLIQSPSGLMEVVSPRPDLEFEGGSVWERDIAGDTTHYKVGVAGEEFLTLAWAGRLEAGGAVDKPSGGREESIYGIRIPQSQHLTLINSDGTCVHFAEYQIPRSEPGPLILRLPPNSRIVSLAIDEVEREKPAVTDDRVQVELPWPGVGSQVRRVSLRLACPPLRLGFLGELELNLPEADTTIGTLSWVIALPRGFPSRVVSSGSDLHHGTPDLSGFGDFGRAVQSQELVAFSKSLLPAIPVSVRLSYHQLIPGATDDLELELADKQGDRPAGP